MCEKHLLEQIDKDSKNEGTCCYEETLKCNLSRGQHDEMVECDHCEDEDQTTYHYMCFVDHIYQQHGYKFDDWDKYRSRCLQCWNKLLITKNIPVLQDGSIAVCQHQCTYGSRLNCDEDGHRLYYQTAVQCYNTTCLNQVHPECYIKYMQDWWVKRDQSAFDKNKPYCVDCATTKAREADKTNLPVCAYNNVYHCCDEGNALSDALHTVCNRTKSCKVRVHMECFLNYVDQYYDADFPNDKAMCMQCVLYHAKKNKHKRKTTAKETEEVGKLGPSQHCSFKDILSCNHKKHPRRNCTSVPCRNPKCTDEVHIGCYKYYLFAGDLVMLDTFKSEQLDKWYWNTVDDVAPPAHLLEKDNDAESIDSCESNYEINKNAALRDITDELKTLY